MATDAELLDWIEERARRSPSGISFDWVPAVEGEPSGFRFMRRFFIGEPRKTIRDAIVSAMAGNPIAERERAEQVQP
jgi:hypothetical protein